MMKNGTATLETPVAPALPNLDEPLFEIVNGEKVEMPPMGAYSTMLAFWLGQLLDSFARPRALGNVAVEMLFVLDPVRDIRRRPDVAFVSAQKWPLDRPIPESGDWDVVPDLAVEVISPNDVF